MNFCPNCGKKLEADETVCNQCGAPIGFAENSDVNENAPVNNQNSYQNTYQQPVSQPDYRPDAAVAKDIDNANILGIVSLVFSLLGLFVMSTVGFIVGIIGMSRVRKYKDGYMFPNQQAKTAYNLNKAGLIISVIKLSLLLLLCIVLFIALIVMGAGFIADILHGLINM